MKTQQTNRWHQTWKDIDQELWSQLKQRYEERQRILMAFWDHASSTDDLVATMVDELVGQQIEEEL